MRACVRACIACVLYSECVSFHQTTDFFNAFWAAALAGFELDEMQARPPALGIARSRCRCGQGEPSPSADVGGGEPSPGADKVEGAVGWAQGRCMPMWHGASPLTGWAKSMWAG